MSDSRARMPFRLAVMMYHYVRDPRAEPGAIGGLPLARFDAHLDELAANWQVVSWPRVQAFLVGGAALPESACLLTFDDGIADHYQHVFPRLRQRGMSGLFFVLARQPGDGLAVGFQLHYLLARMGPAGVRTAIWRLLSPAQIESLEQAKASHAVANPALRDDDGLELLKLIIQRADPAVIQPVLSQLIEREIGPERALAARHHLSPAQLGEMTAAGMSFGGHSRSHPWLNNLSPAQQAAEVEASARWLALRQPAPWAFAYPYGGFDEHTPACLQAAGFAAGFTTREQMTHASPYLIGRYDGEYFSPADVRALAAPGAPRGVHA